MMDPRLSAGMHARDGCRLRVLGIARTLNVRTLMVLGR